MNANNALFATPDVLIDQIHQLSYQNQVNHDLLVQANYEKNAMCHQIIQLQAQVAKAAAEKWENPRCFDMQPSGVIYSIESSGRRKEIGTMKLEQVEAFTTVTGGQKRKFIKVRYCCGLGLQDTAVIPAEQIVKGLLLPYFKVFQRRCSKALANEFLYWMMMQILNGGSLTMSYYPEFPGLRLQAEDGAIKDIDYVCSDGEEDEAVVPYLSPNYLHKTLPFTDKSCTQLLTEVQPYLTGNAVYVLLAFGLAGLLSTYLMYLNDALPVVLTAAAQDADGEALANVFLTTYDRCKAPHSLTMTKTELTKLLRAAKDETVVLCDDSTAESNVKRTSAVDTILRIRSDENYKPHHIAILSRTIHHFIPAERVLPLEMENSFGKGISAAERCQLGHSLAGMRRYFVDEFSYSFHSHSQTLYTAIEALKAEEHGFRSEGAKTTFAVLYGVLMLWAEIFHAKLPDGCKDYLAKCIVDSQNMETGKELAVVNEFFRQLNCDISSGVLSIAELGRDMAFREKQNIIIHDDDLLLMEESTVKDVILPHMTTAATVNGILTALAAEGYLISTNGHRKPTTVYDENRISKQLKLIAFRYQEMVSSDLLRYIESMKTKQYFCSEVPEEHFVPLVQNELGATAGQLLQRGSNQHRFVTGKSGSGKTVFLISLLYWLSQAGNRVVVLDANASFTREALEAVLPKAFIENHITFHHIEEDGLPVNLFHTYETDKHRARKNMLCNILGEAIHETSQNQAIALKTIVDRMMQQTGTPSYLDFLIQLENAEGTSETSVVNKLKPLLEEMLENGDDPQDDWFTFLSKCKDVVILTMGDIMGENGSQMTDMLLASLYYAQRHADTSGQLSIFIDEIQNQNLSGESIISKILKEGRKHGIDLNFATQYVDSAKQNRMMKQASLSVYFRPDLASRASVASMLGLKKSELYKLDELKPGECFVQGTVYNFEVGCVEEAVISGKIQLLAENG